jgi:hypothetical protein
MKRLTALFVTASAALALTALLVWPGCAPKESVPTGPTHPANPAAAEAPDAPAPSSPTEEAPAGGGHDHGHGGNEHGSTGDAPDGEHGHGGAAKDDPAALIAAEMSAYQAAKPVFDGHCASCHTSSDKASKARKKALGHFTMDAYPFGGHHAGELGATIRKVLGVDGGKPTMPKDDPGAVEGEALELVVAWSRAYDAAAKAGAGYHGESKAHDHHGGHHHHGD